MRDQPFDDLMSVADDLARQVAELSAENARLRADLAKHEHAVHIVPQGVSASKAMEDVGRDAKPGDRLLFHGGSELVLDDQGVWGFTE